MKVAEVLKAKSESARTGGVITIAPTATIRELVATLSHHNIGAVIVSADSTSVDGIASERDVVRRLVDGPQLLDQPVSSIMTSAVHSCGSDAELTELMEIMTEHRVRHLPVLDDGALVGIMSIGDVVKHRISQLQFERDQLDSYVHQS